ncbi:YggS family pyridoxal phosphate-dependent enzyme [Roseovarius sp.]|uniref:YggS family pyridoxal phosphate-dependent enzyme n=1 Tax=Roseovarius sp. TaxID=1486281 RepID=UPI003A97C35A
MAEAGATVDVGANLREVKAQIEAAEQAAGRAPGEVTLVAVGKVQPVEKVEAALAEGQRIFGENRVQEAQGKWPELKARYPDVTLHLIGPLQTNKAADAIALFDVIETVDRPKLARVLAAEMKKQGRMLECFVQVNTGEEDQKAGVLPADADAFIETCRDEHGLNIVGLMCIPPADDEPALHFALLREIARRHGLEKLSMGMRGHYGDAIEVAGTHVRGGTAIFGDRLKPAG